MRLKLAVSALAGILVCAAALTGCSKGGENADAAVASAAAQDPERAAASQRIAQRFEAMDASMKQAAELDKRAKAGEDVRAQIEALEKQVPQLDDLKEDALKVVAADPSDESALQAIDALLRTNKLEFDPEANAYPSEGPEAQEEARMAKLLLAHHVNRPRILEMRLKLDRLGQLDFWHQTFETSRDPMVKANFAALLADYYFAELGKPKLTEAEREAFREQGMHFVEVIRKDYSTVLPSQTVKVPSYLRPPGQTPDYRGPDFPTLAKVMDDRVRVLDQSVGSTVPNLQAQTIAGKPDALTNYRGKVVVLDVWATWCGTCKSALPKLAELKRELKGQPFEIIGVSGDDQLATLTAFLEKDKLPWVQWHAGSEHQIMQTLGIDGFPTYLVVDAHGVLRQRSHHFDDNSSTLIRGLVEKAARI